MNCCEHCPSRDASLHGHDPEALDILADIRTDEEAADMGRLWCPWKGRVCPMGLRNGRIAARCNREGRPLPFKLAPIFAKRFPEHAAQFGVKGES